MKAIITLNNEKWPVPEEITVGQFSQVASLGLEDLKARRLICAIILDAPLQTFSQVEEEELEGVFNLTMASMLSLNEPRQYDGPIDFEQLTFGQFVDLDSLSHMGLNDNMVEVISIIWQHEPEQIWNTPMARYWRGLEMWIERRKQVYEKYATFFNPDNIEASETDEPAEAQDVRRAWYQAIVTLAGEDFLKVNQVVDRPLIEALNFLSYLKDQAIQKQQAQRHRLAQMKHR
jgi:hypothetical protein